MVFLDGQQKITLARIACLCFCHSRHIPILSESNKEKLNFLRDLGSVEIFQSLFSSRKVVQLSSSRVREGGLSWLSRKMFKFFVSFCC